MIARRVLRAHDVIASRMRIARRVIASRTWSVHRMIASRVHIRGFADTARMRSALVGAGSLVTSTLIFVFFVLVR